MPIEIAPAMSSAIPPATTNLEVPNDDNPAAKAKGTVKPSESPITLQMHLNAPSKTKKNIIQYSHVTDDVRID